MRELRWIAIGAHPDDCEYRFAGTASKLVSRGDAVQFVSITNGDAGHHELSGEALARRRKAEAEEARRRLGIAAYEILDQHDGLFEPSLALREQVIRLIRQWRADVVLSHRPNDYHPDHRYTAQVVQDSAYLILVPNVCPDAPALRSNPVYMYFEDDFSKPQPFSPDIAVEIESTWAAKIDSLDAHVSQFYEWLPWVEGKLEHVPAGAAERRSWLERWMRRAPAEAVKAALVKRYGSTGTAPAEAFELCEYGRQASPAELDEMFPR